MNTNEMKWIREPSKSKYSVSEDRIEIETIPHTDLWQRTYYHFQIGRASCRERVYVLV